MTEGACCRITRWKTASAAVAGRAHEVHGDGCQDRVGQARRNGVVAVALADGAGSARHAEAGAAAAVEGACALLCDSFDALWALDPAAVAEAMAGPLQEKLVQRAAELEAPPEELACTLLFTAVSGQRYLAGSIGDGIVGCGNGTHGRALFAPEKGEFLNETVFLTSRRAGQMLRVSKGEPFDWFCLMSDGTAETFYQRQTGALSSGPARAAGWLRDYREPEVSVFLENNLHDQLRDQTGDDCSLSVLARVSFPIEDFRQKTVAYQREFLGCSSKAQVLGRLKALERILGTDPATLAARQRANWKLHYQALRPFLEELPEP